MIAMDRSQSHCGDIILDLCICWQRQAEQCEWLCLASPVGVHLLKNMLQGSVHIGCLEGGYSVYMVSVWIITVSMIMQAF